MGVTAYLAKSTGGGPYLFFRSPEPLPGEPILRPLAGLYKTRNSHLAGNTTAFRETLNFRFVDDLDLEMACYPFNVADSAGTVDEMMRDLLR